MDLQELNRILEEVGQKKLKLGFDLLNEAEQTLYCVDVAMFEIELGGLTTFYYNTSGNYALETVKAFERIGNQQMANLIRRANNLFLKGIPPQDQGDRYDVMHSLENSGLGNKLNELTQEFNRRDEFDDMLLRYAETNRELLPK